MLKWYLWLNCFGNNINVLTINCLFFNCCLLTQITICVKNLKYLSLIITIKVFHIFTPFQFSNYNLLSLLFCLICRSALPVLYDKVKALNNCVKIVMVSNNSVHEVVVDRRFFLSKSLRNCLRAIFTVGLIIKSPKTSIMI